MFMFAERFLSIVLSICGRLKLVLRLNITSDGDTLVVEYGVLRYEKRNFWTSDSMFFSSTWAVRIALLSGRINLSASPFA